MGLPPVWLKAGDVMELGIEGLGSQRQTVVPAHDQRSDMSTPSSSPRTSIPPPDGMIKWWRRSGRRLPPCTTSLVVSSTPSTTHRTARIVMIEKWTSVGELDEHGVGEAVRALNASLEGLLASPTEVTRLVPLPAGTEEQGQL